VWIYALFPDNIMPLFGKISWQKKGE
jgi:hypothetical protein